MNPADFLAEFCEDAAEKLDLIANRLLRLERDSSSLQAVREMFLAAHTIKGGAAMLRLTDVEALAHALEDLLSSFRDGQRTVVYQRSLRSRQEESSLEAGDSCPPDTRRTHERGQLGWREPT